MPVGYVIGASRGIGRAIAERGVSLGYTVVAHARSEDDLATLRDLAPERVRTHVVDAGDPAALVAALTEALEAVGAPDSCVYAAGGTGPLGPFAVDDVAQIRATFDVHALGALAAGSVLLPAMAERGRFCLLGAPVVDHPFPGMGAYVVAKAAQDGARAALAAEAPRGVAVFSLRPGATDTALMRAMASADPERFPAARKLARLAGRGALATPERVADAFNVAAIMAPSALHGRAVDVDDLLSGARVTPARG